MQIKFCVAAVAGALFLAGGMRGVGAESVQKPIREAGFTDAAYKQDYRGFPLVPNEDLRRWATMVEANRSP